MLTNRTLTEQQTLIRRHFTDFFESERNEEKYHRRIQEMIVANKARLVMDMGDLLDFVPLDAAATASAEGALDGSGGGRLTSHNASARAAMTNPTSLGAGLLCEPGTYVPLLQLALHDVVLRQQPEYLKVDYRSRTIHVGFEGPVGTVLSPRELYARHLNTMVALEGIVTRQSANRPRLLETVHYCPETNKFTRKEFRDQLTPMLDSAHLPTVNVMPKTDMEGHALRTELGLSTFMDSQCAVLQEAPERAPTGQLPRSVELRFDDDLVDCVKPGDRVVLVGVYMPYTTADSKSFQTIVVVNHVVPMRAYSAAATRPLPAVEEKLVAFMRKCVQQGGAGAVLRTLANAVAPTIYGLTNEKRAILLMMVGGVERVAHSTHIRGDINILLVGEPSTAKSQLLRFVLGIAPLALSTTGKGSSGVGLTAAVTVDNYTGERSLSAGAMVLADRGILCIDEFDKMNAQDRVAMHEAMEQQTVTIAKAGIHASLNARCSVLAAANPIYGFYSVQHKLAFNVGLPESLLSRFDLTFIILDQHSSEYNRRIGHHILRNHLTAQPVGYDPAGMTRTIVEGEAAEALLPQHLLGLVHNSTSNSNHNEAASHATAHDELSESGHAPQPPSFSSSSSPSPSSGNAESTVVSVNFLRAYIQLAKQGAPLLTETSQQLISQHYVQLRAEQQESSRDGFFITARTLEAIVRLATAHAKLRLSPTIDDADVTAAMALLRASVHAATDASQKRDADNMATLDSHPSDRNALLPGQKRPNGVEPIASSATAARARTEADTRAAAETNTTTTTATTRDTIEPVATEDGSAQTNVQLGRRIIAALKQCRQEQRSSLTLRELHERVGGDGGTTLALLRRQVHAMQGDAFVVEDAAAAPGEAEGDDMIQLL